MSATHFTSIVFVCAVTTAALAPQPNENSADAEPQVVCGNDDFQRICCHCDDGGDPEFYRDGTPVARITFQSDADDEWYNCTGFLIGEHNRMITNAHCINSAAECDSAVIRFDFEKKCHGKRNRKTRKFECDALLCTSAALDYSLLDVSGNPQATYGSVPVDETNPLVVGTILSIPQHPRGWRKQSLETDCQVQFIGATEFRYDCDTAPGSSGSPVMSDHEVVGLHRASSCTDTNMNGQCDSDETHCPNRATRIAAIIADIETVCMLNLGTPQPRPGCPGNCKGGSFCGASAVSASFAAFDDISISGIHALQLTAISPVTITDPGGTVMLPAESVQGSVQIENLYARGLTIDDADTTYETRMLGFRVSAMDLTLNSFIGSDGQDTGLNTVELNQDEEATISLDGESGVVSVTGEMYGLLTNDLTSPLFPAKVTFNFEGTYDFDNQLAQLTLAEAFIDLDNPIPAIGSWGILVLTLLLCTTGSIVLRRSSRDAASYI